MNSLKPEYEGKILFVEANVTTPTGRAFSQFHGVSNVTLVLFKPDGTRLPPIQGVHDSDYWRRVFKSAFDLDPSN